MSVGYTHDKYTICVPVSKKNKQEKITKTTIKDYAMCT